MVSLASIVLLLGAYYAYAAAFLIPDSGLAYSTDWTIQRRDSCGRREEWCAANPGDLQPGDRMLSIGGVTHGDYVSDRWLVAFDGYGPGDLVPIEYSREGQVRSTEWLMPATTLRDRLWHLTSAWPFVPFWIAGTAVLLFLRPRDERWRLLIAFNYITALWYLVGLVSTFHVAAAAFVVRIASWLFVPITLHLHLTVPSPLFSAKRTQAILRPLYLVSAGMAVVETLWILPAIIFYLGMLTAIAGSIGLLIYRQFDRSSAASRLATRQMLMGIILAFGPGLALWVVPSILGIQVNSPLAVQISALALPLLPLFYTYAIYKRHLGDSEFRASRLLGTYSFLLIYLTAVALIYLIGSRWIDTSTQSLVFGVVISTIFVVAAPSLRARYQSFVDRVVYGAVYNPDEIIQAFATRIPMAATHQAIADLIVGEVLPSLLIRQSALLIRSGSAWEPVYARGIGLEPAEAGPAGYHALLAEAGHYREPVEPTDQQHQALVALRGPEPFEWVRLALPLGSPDKPVGIWLFGQRDPDDFYAQSEIRVLRALAGQVTVALENAQLYRFLQQQADEITMLYRASAGLINPGSDLSAVAERIVRTVMREFASATPLVDCSLLLLDEGHQALRRVVTSSAFPVAGTAVPLNGAGLVVAAFQSAEVIYVPDVSLDRRYVANEPRTRSELAIPLRSGERVIGVLDLQSSEPDAFDERARRIVAAFAERAALALENTLLLGHLDQARRVAEEANQLKSEFLANTSHELRTPLTGILGSLNVVLDDLCESPEEERDFLQVAYTSAQHLLTIVNDILDIARIEAGKMEIIPYALDVSHVLNEVFALTRVQAEEKNLRLEIRTLQGPPVLVYADHDRLRQILLNLVGNAIKFTHQGQITVQACPDADRGEMAIEVVDTGIGIAPEKQGKLFQPFVQVDGSQTRQYGGTGLGLSISRRLAEQMHGTLALFSAGEGQGSRFTLRLPLAGTTLERHPQDGFGPVER